MLPLRLGSRDKAQVPGGRTLSPSLPLPGLPRPQLFPVEWQLHPVATPRPGPKGPRHSGSALQSARVDPGPAQAGGLLSWLSETPVADGAHGQGGMLLLATSTGEHSPSRTDP